MGLKTYLSCVTLLTPLSWDGGCAALFVARGPGEDAAAQPPEDHQRPPFAPAVVDHPADPPARREGAIPTRGPIREPRIWISEGLTRADS